MLRGWVLLPLALMLTLLGVLLLTWGDGHAAYDAEDAPVQIINYRTAKGETIAKYEWMGRFLEETLRRQLPDVNIIEDAYSVGSLHTLALMDKNPGVNTIGIVQADVLHHYIMGGHKQLPTKRDKSVVRAVARLFEEDLQIAPVKPEEIADPSICSDVSNAEKAILQASRVKAARVGSGTMVTAINVGQVLFTGWEKYHGAQNSEGVLKIRAVSSPRFFDSSNKACALGLKKSTVQVLENAYPRVYRAHPLIKGKDGEDDGFMLAWDAILVASKGTSKRVLDAILVALDKIDETHCRVPPQAVDCVPKYGSDYDPEKLLANCTNYCEPVAQSRTVMMDNHIHSDRFHNLPIIAHDVLIHNNMDLLSRFFFTVTEPRFLKTMLLLLLGLSLLATLFPRMSTALQRTTGVSSLVRRIADTKIQWFKMLLIVILFHIVIAILIWLSELRGAEIQSENDFVCGGVMESFRLVFSFMVFNNPPARLESEFAWFWVGVLKAGWALATIALSASVGTNIYEWLKLRNMDGSIIIIGNNRNKQKVEQELTKEGKLHHTVSDVSELTLTELPDNSAIVILGDSEQAKAARFGEVDNWVCRQIMDLRGAESRLSKDPSVQLTPIRIVAQAENGLNVELMKRAGADEVICADELEAELIAQSCTKEGLKSVFRELLDTTDTSQEIYYDELSPTETTKYRSFKSAVAQYPQRYPGRLPIGIKRKGDRGAEPTVLLNPTGKDGQLHRGDALVVLARAPRDAF